MPDIVLCDRPVETVNFVGDSRVRMFDALRFEDRTRPGTEIRTRARWRPHFRAAEFFGEGRFGEEMSRIWWELRVAVHDRSGGSLVFTPRVYRLFGDIYERMGLRPNEPHETIVAVSCATDARDIEQEYQEFRLRFDEPTPFEGLLPEHRATAELDQTGLLAVVDARLAPVYAGMRALRDLGFTKLFVVGCAPPSPEVREGWTPPAVRYAVRYAWDLAFKRFCAESGIGFVDVWDALARDGLRDERLAHDPEHANLAGAAVILDRIYATLRAREAATSDPR